MKWKESIKDILPPIFLKLYKKHISKATPFHCPVCKSNISHFNQLQDYYVKLLDKYEYVHSIFCGETANFFNYSCQVCGTSDRNRLYTLYLEKVFMELNNNNKKYNFLDIAPDKKLSAWLKNFECINYRSVDLMSQIADDKADITDMYIYKEGQFNIILCSHVLEHIENDRKALSEIYRILNKDGFAIIMAPIILTLENDLENKDYQSEADRWKYYGQDDHVRVYSKKGFINKLTEAGFTISQHGVDFFGKEVFDKCGIHCRSVLYIAKK